MTRRPICLLLAGLLAIAGLVAACGSSSPAGPAGPAGANAISVSGGETATISKPGGCGKDPGDDASWNVSLQTDTLSFMLDITLEKTFTAGTYATGVHETGKATVFMYAGSGGPSYDVVVGAGTVKADPSARVGSLDLNLTDARSGKSVHVVGVWSCESWDEGMSEAHPLVRQLRFTRAEFVRALKGVDAADAERRILPMNCISWNIGHLAWQEQRYFLTLGQGTTPYPDIERRFESGGPASTPPMKEVLAAWRAITAAADPWLDTLTSATLQEHPLRQGKPLARIHGNLLQRVIYHYWYHTGENMAIRQQLGHRRLPQFVGAIDDEAPYRPEDR